MKALMFDQTGLPADVVELRETREPKPGPGEALVRVLLSPIIPGDALFMQGLYPQPIRPRLPGETAGNYGAGIVQAVGPGVDLRPGALVTATMHRGLWAQAAAIPASRLISLPETYRHDLAAEFMNLITAWDLLEKAAVVRGQWLAVTGGNSTVAVLLTQFASALGVRVVSLVRKMRSTPDLKALGADAVLTLDDTSPLREAVLEITGGGLHAVVDCVGGLQFAELARALRFGSRAVIYGAFSAEPFSLHNLDILLNNLDMRSYVYRYFFNPPAIEDERRIRQILALSAHLDVEIPAAGRYPLECFKQALTDAASGAGPGRRYFMPNAEGSPAG